MNKNNIYMTDILAAERIIGHKLDQYAKYIYKKDFLEKIWDRIVRKLR